jgi:flagellin
MSMRVNSLHPSTLDALRNSQKNRKGMDKSMEKLSSGKRINRAGDDAAGLAIAEKLGQALRGLEQGMENIYDGFSMSQVADGGLSQVTDNLGRMRELAMTSANGTLNQEQRDAVNAEYESLKSEITRISASTEFNGTKLLDGSAGEVDIAVGQDPGSADGTISLDFSANMDAASLGLESSSVDGADPANALAAMDDLEAALASVSSHRADIGASSNRLMSAHQGLAVAVENTYAAQSRIMDVDYAKETAELTRTQILNQANNAMLVQSRGIPATALNLLK